MHNRVGESMTSFSSGYLQVESYKPLRFGLRSVFYERPQAIGRPLKRRLGSAGDDFGLLWPVRLWKGIVRWYLAHQEKAPKRTAAWHGDSPILGNQKKTAMTGEGRVNVIRIFLSQNNLQS